MVYDIINLTACEMRTVAEARNVEGYENMSRQLEHSQTRLHLHPHLSLPQDLKT